ncbi:hypothetical protein KFK09_007167 [Dendrobium nobile]|uniref:RNase H type-1 domain-containing protein n=1 Tax=Dendrobium nobile TaxID=94219 RepID=A0A8T3BRE6_DENNO|nr:hypothetical protein KFK09_007167 [Dendrobium nobile]
MEDTEHIAVKCRIINNVCSKLDRWNFHLPSFNSLENCINELRKLSVQNSIIGNLYCSMSFCCWKSRNKPIHGGNEESCSFLAANALEYAFGSFRDNPVWDNWEANQHLVLGTTAWLPPPPGWIKCNVDASLSSNYVAGIGGVFRDDKGRFYGAFGFSINHWDIAQVEVLSILSLRKYVQDWMLDAKGIMTEGDNHNVILLFQRAFHNNSISEECLNPKDLDFLKGFKQVIFSFARRECNKLADVCANFALRSDFFGKDLNDSSIPPFLHLLKKEFICTCFNKIIAVCIF